MTVHDFRPAGPEHDEFTKWAKAQGIQISGVAAVAFAGRGIGIAALRDIDAGETIVSVPTSSLLTLDNIPSAFKSKFQADTPVQGIFAAYLACDDAAKAKYALWQATWPTMQDFEASMPLLWPEYVIGTKSKQPHENGEDAPQKGFCSLLPPSVSGYWNSIPSSHQVPSDYSPTQQRLFHDQYDRFQRALKHVKLVYPCIDLKAFTYYWLAAHTRCFFYVAKNAAVPEDRNEAMALCPFADYFNHSCDDPGCEATFDEDGYSFTTTKSYGKG
ncbi:predicted protein [Uncinocarpus reesii 1704]|uniref:SET domain-containing protein n=1 Tax=Uncinocarpus reesii (strain UAMH 1704) TaxID=336963 RepID=C4JE57_UNCRE|nr:uncharacterized protein UREG_00479 [Uncinocarpus reesii 1704]EEP75633.1 predicted protein [Uncinocarpus reesii 1704]